MGPDIVLGDVT